MIDRRRNSFELTVFPVALNCSWLWERFLSVRSGPGAWAVMLVTSSCGNSHTQPMSSRSGRGLGCAHLWVLVRSVAVQLGAIKRFQGVGSNPIAQTNSFWMCRILAGPRFQAGVSDVWEQPMDCLLRNDSPHGRPHFGSGVRTQDL